MDPICEDSHMCFGKVAEPKPHTSHLCFGKRHTTTLQPLETAAISSVIEDAVNELHILKRTLPVDKHAQWNEDFQDIQRRYSASPRPPKLFPELAGIWPEHIAAMLKVQQDRTFVEQVLSSTLEELKTRGSFMALRTSMDNHWAMVADEHTLLSQLAERTDASRALAKKLKLERNHLNVQSKFWDEKKDLLTATVHDTHLISGLTLDYARAWERARCQQHELILVRKEDALHDAIEKTLDQDTTDEDRAHLDIMRYIDMDLETLKKDLDVWADAYDEEMNKRETDLIIMRNSREQQLKEHAGMRAEARQRVETMKKALELRVVNEKKRRTLQNIVAIQAWWRGVSFRRGFNKKGKKKKGKRGKKKGKGKKGKGKKK